MICSAGMVLSVTLGVFYRYFLKTSLVWTTELPRYLLIYITFLGGSLALRRGQHATIDILVNRLPKKIKSIVYVCQLFLVLVFIVVIAVLSLKLLLSPTIIGQLTPAMQLPMYAVFAVIPVSFMYMIIVQLYNIFEYFYNNKQ